MTLVPWSLVACGEEREDIEPEQPTPRVNEVAALPPNDDVRLYKRSRPMMGTVFEITVAGATDEQAAAPVNRALDEIARLEDLLSEWRPESEISRINHAAGRAPVAVGEETFRVVEAGVDVSRWSDGAFDLSWAALRGLYDFRPNQEHTVPTRQEIRARTGLIEWQDIRLDPEDRTVFLRRRGMAIGTGGIAKGYALDRAAQILLDAGLESFMLFGGGQVQVRGQRGNRAWRVGIQHPREADYFAFVEATGGSISTSGDYEHFFVDPSGKRWHHLLDPKTGLPAEGTLSVTVISEVGLYSDALSTACFILGHEKCAAMMDRVPSSAEAIIVDDQFRLHTTGDAMQRLHLTAELESGTIPH